MTKRSVETSGSLNPTIPLQDNSTLPPDLKEKLDQGLKKALSEAQLDIAINTAKEQYAQIHNMSIEDVNKLIETSKNSRS